MPFDLDSAPDSPPNDSFARWLDVLLRRRGWVIALTLVAVGALAAGGRSLEMKGDYRVFFAGENERLRAFDALQATFTRRDDVLFAVAPRDGQGDGGGTVFEPEILRAIGELTARAWHLPFAVRVDSLTNYQHSFAREDELVVEDLVPDPARVDPQETERIRRVALGEPILVGRLLAPDSRVAAVDAVVRFESDAQEDQLAVVEAARALAREVEAEFPAVKIYLSGVVMHNHAFAEAGETDARTLVPAMYAAILLLLALLFRSLLATFASLAVIVLSTLAALGAAGWLGYYLTPVSVLAPTLVTTLAVADSVHLLLPFLRDLRAGRDRFAAIRDSVRTNFRPIFLTSLTTAVGFLAMNTSDVPPLRDLGNVTALGVVAAFVLSITFLPALLAALPFRVDRRSIDHATRDEHARPAWTDRLAELVIRRRRATLVATSAIALALVACVPLVELDDQFVDYFDERIRFRTDTDFVLENLTGLYQVEMSLSSGAPGGVSEPEFLATVERFAAWWRERDDVVHVATLSDVMRRLHRNLHGDDPAFERLPESREAAAQYLLLYEMSLPRGLDLTDQVDIEKSSIRFTVTFDKITSSALREAAAEGEAWLRENAPASMPTLARTTATSPAILFAHISRDAITSMIWGTAAGFLAITLCLVVALGSVRLGLLSLVPNLLPTFMAFGAWGLFVGRVGFGISVVLAMTLGIVVDDTVHFTSKYAHARRRLGLAPDDAVRFVFRRVGRALWVTTLALAAGFALLATSSFAQNADMGLLTAITLSFALVTDFLLLPAILLALDRTESPLVAATDSR